MDLRNVTSLNTLWVGNTVHCLKVWLDLHLQDTSQTLQPGLPAFHHLSRLPSLLLTSHPVPHCIEYVTILRGNEFLFTLGRSAFLTPFSSDISSNLNSPSSVQPLDSFSHPTPSLSFYSQSTTNLYATRFISCHAYLPTHINAHPPTHINTDTHTH